MHLYTGIGALSQSKTNQQQQQHGTTNPYCDNKSGVVQVTSTINTSYVNVAPSSASITAVNTEQQSKQSKKPQRHLRKTLKNLNDTASSTSNTAFAFSKVKQVDQDNNNANINDSDSEHDKELSSHPLVQHECFLMLIGKDFYYFKNKEDPAHKGMRNL